MSLSPGTRVAHYQLLRQLGAGGMGEVFLAQDSRLDRQVAIKFLMAPADPVSRRRLLREAKAVASLEHPSVVSIYEIGSDEAGGDFIVMPYVLGETLAKHLRRGALSMNDALALGEHVASALAAAHRRGIVHRDLKPQNIILTPSGLPMLLDFGLARHTDASTAAAEAPTESLVTEAHALVGTSGYMAPEQLRGMPIDPRSDLFGLGCVMYECLCGRRAFSGSSSADVVGQVLHVEPAPPSSVRTDGDADADALIARLLQKDPANRFQSADEVLGAIRVIQTARGSHISAVRSASDAGLSISDSVTPPITDRWSRRRVVATAAVVAAVAIALFGVWQWQQPRGLPQPKPEATRSYTLALEALREGSYQVAQGNLLEAVRLDENFALAYVRLAEAYAELDKLTLAKDALVRVGLLVPNRNRLGAEDALRLRAVQAYVLREHDDAIAAYRQLAERTPKDPRGWVDLGRAEDNAGRRVQARAHFEQARNLDNHYPPARVRLGTLLGQLGRTNEALAEFDEAIRLYRTASNTEGMAEAMVRRGTALTSAGRLAEARASVAETLALATGPSFAYQRVRAMFDHARLTAIEGQFTQAMAIATKAVDEAKGAGLPSSAAFGLREIGTTLTYGERHTEAEAVLTEAIAIAEQNSAERAGMLARLQQAMLRNEQRRYRDALALSEAPVQYFTDSSYPRNLAEAQVIRARAHEALEEFAQAEPLTRSALAFAENYGDTALLASSLENLVGQLETLGRLPDALRERERVEGIYRSQKNSSLAYSLVNHANILTQLGRGPEADPLLDELEQQISAGSEAYLGRKTPGKLARARAATTMGRFDLVAAAAAGIDASAVSNALVGRVLAEHADARLGRSRTAIATIASWPSQATSTGGRLELAYWVAHTLLLRKDAARSAEVAVAALAEPGASVRPEVRWRLGAVAAIALAQTDPSRSATIRAAAESALSELRKTWDPTSLATYLKRADLAGLTTR